MIPKELARNVKEVWGDDGIRWLAELPSILRRLANDWDFTVGSPYELSYHYVTAVTCGDGAPAVLKLGVPTGTSLAEEASALAAFAGRGAVRLLRTDLTVARCCWNASPLVGAPATWCLIGMVRRPPHRLV